MLLAEDMPVELCGLAPILPLLGLVNDPDVRGLNWELAVEDAGFPCIEEVPNDLVLIGV
jgi:hypothetical protein